MTAEDKKSWCEIPAVIDRRRLHRRPAVDGYLLN
jgi:hypothetical protein